MAPTKTRFIRNHIQSDNFRRTYRIAMLGLCLIPLLAAGVAGCCWGLGVSVVPALLWGAASELLTAAAVFVMRSFGRQNSRMLLGLWLCFLLYADLLAFMLKNVTAAQLLFWSMTMLFAVGYVSTSACWQGLLPQLLAGIGMVFRFQLGQEAVMYNLLLLLACAALSYFSGRLSEQRYINLWQLRLADSEAETDPMTGLYNRRGFEHRFHKLLEACANWRRSLAVFMIDIDFFKKYNDAFGHPEGDKCIRAVAEQIRSAAQQTGGICARIGGEEFMLVLTNDSEDEVVAAAERLSQSVEELKLRQAPGNFYPYVTISIGIQYCGNVQKASADALYEQADRALYLAKANGRNTIYLGQNCVKKKHAQHSA